MVGYLTYGVVVIAIMILIAIIWRAYAKLMNRGVAVKVGGEAGYAIRNARNKELIDVPWVGAITVASIFEKCCNNKYSNEKLFGERKVESKDVVTGSDGRKVEKLYLGDYQWTSYEKAFQQVENFASGLVNFGHNVDTRVAIFAENRPRWQIALQGCFRQGITVVPLYTSLGEEALIHCLNETRVSTLICDLKQLDKVAAISSSLKTVTNIIYIADDYYSNSNKVAQVLGLSRSDWKVSSFTRVMNLAGVACVPCRLPYSEDVAVITYTSGSTGPPKGVMITHGNLVATATALKTLIPFIPAVGSCPDVYLACLPLANIFELAAELAMLLSGCRIGYGSLSTLTDNSRNIMKGAKGDASVLKPTIMAADPAILDRLRQGVLRDVEEEGGLTKKLFSIAYKRRLAAIKGIWHGAWGIEECFWYAIVFRKIRAVLGGRIRFVLCGGAPLSRNTQRFIDICMLASLCQGYGLTETCAAAAFTTLDETTVGQVGPPLPSCYIKLVSWEEGGYTITDKPMPRGEVVVGGFNVSKGYFNNPGATNEVYKVDGRGVRWLYTGDIGQFHPNGFLEIIGRKKDIVIRGATDEAALNFLDNVMIDNMMVDATASGWHKEQTYSDVWPS